MTSQSLYIFVTSERPDQYLNPVVYCLLKKSIVKVKFLYIKGLSDETAKVNDPDKEMSLAVSRKVQSLLDDLSLGNYTFYVGKRKTINLQDVYPEMKLIQIKSVYKRCLEMKVRWDYEDINYLDLRKELASIHKKEPNSIFDVTAVKKSILGDIISCSIIEGIHNIYTFDLKIKPNYDEPWIMLFHDLEDDNSKRNDYQYINIVDTPIFRNCSNSILARTLPFKLSLIIAFIVLIAMLVINYYYGEINWLVQVTFIFASIASLLSLLLNLFQPSKF